MSANRSQDPLDALQSLIDDVLIQTGKALRASRKDAQGHLTQAPEVAPPKLQETIRQYHSALDSLESDILRAKAVLLRDLNQIQERKRLFIVDPQPVEPQSKHTIAVDLDSPPPHVMIKEEPVAQAQEAPRPLMAPFPNMSIDLPANPDQFNASVKGAVAPPQPAPLPMSLDHPNGVPHSHPAGPSSALPHPMADADFKMDSSHGPSGMNFTDMEFSLAPPSSADHQAPAAAAAAAANVPPSLAAHQHAPSLNPAAAIINPHAQEKVEDKKGDPADPSASSTSTSSSSKLHDFFANGSGAADGMDFDFSLGGGEETFNNMMNNRGASFNLQMDPAGGPGGPPTTSSAATTVGKNNRSVPAASSFGAAAAAGTTTSSSDAIVNNGGLSSSEFDAMIMGLDDPDGP